MRYPKAAISASVNWVSVSINVSGTDNVPATSVILSSPPTTVKAVFCSLTGSLPPEVTTSAISVSTYTLTAFCVGYSVVELPKVSTSDLLERFSFKAKPAFTATSVARALKSAVVALPPSIFMVKVSFAKVADPKF